MFNHTGEDVITCRTLTYHRYLRINMYWKPRDDDSMDEPWENLRRLIQSFSGQKNLYKYIKTHKYNCKVLKNSRTKLSGQN